jgi:drug/metabolite transporter (DMT)-like permease
MFPLMLFLWGTYAAGSALMLRMLDVHQLQFWIYLTATATLLTIRCARRGPKGGSPAGAPGWKRFARMAGCGALIFGYFFFYNTALESVPTAEAAVLNYTFPLWIVLLEMLTGGARPTPVKLLALMVGAFGVLFLMTQGNLRAFRLTYWRGDLMALAAALCWALFSLLSRRVEAGLVDSHLVYMAVGMALATAETCAFSSFVWPGWAALAGLLWLGGGSFILSNFLWVRSLKTMPLSLCASVSFLTPFATMLLIALLLRQPLSGQQWAGCAILLAALVLERAQQKPAWPRQNQRA